MEILFSDNSVGITEYLSTKEGKRYINYEDRFGRIPIHEAARNNRNDIVDVLLSLGGNVNLQSTDCKHTALNTVCRILNDEYIDIVLKLLAAGADANIPNLHGDTPLMNAVYSGHFHIANLLIPYTDFTIRNNNGCNVFTYAILSNDEKIFEYIFDFCPDINHITNNGKTYLHYAVNHGRKFAISYLLKKGIDTYITDDYGKTALLN